jgi:hypothetical protein
MEQRLDQPPTVRTISLKLALAPKWAKRDLSSPDPVIRCRAEDTGAATIGSLWYTRAAEEPGQLALPIAVTGSQR